MMSRYQTEFYEPFLHDWSNFGSWTEKGSKDTDQRARELWKGILETAPTMDFDESRIDQLSRHIEKRSTAGGAAPVS
jgi:trimethylamine--corrinoid protein Co-methyltransferase